MNIENAQQMILEHLDEQLARDHEYYINVIHKTRPSDLTCWCYYLGIIHCIEDLQEEFHTTYNREYARFINKFWYIQGYLDYLRFGYEYALGFNGSMTKFPQEIDHDQKEDPQGYVQRWKIQIVTKK